MVVLVKPFLYVLAVLVSHLAAAPGAHCSGTGGAMTRRMLRHDEPPTPPSPVPFPPSPLPAPPSPPSPPSPQPSPPSPPPRPPVPPLPPSPRPIPPMPPSPPPRPPSPPSPPPKPWSPPSPSPSPKPPAPEPDTPRRPTGRSARSPPSPSLPGPPSLPSSSSPELSLGQDDTPAPRPTRKRLPVSVERGSMRPSAQGDGASSDSGDSSLPIPSPPSPRPPRPPPRPPTPATSSGINFLMGGGKCQDAQITLDYINRYRAAHQAPPLQWSSSLAGLAQMHAEKLAARGCDAPLTHSGASGELLYWETGGDMLCRFAPIDWYGEAALYDFTSAPFTDNVINGENDSSHFTQLVWQSTSSVGCGVQRAVSGRYGPCTYVVCRFSSPGNSIGDLPFLSNVLPKTNS